MVSVFSIRDLVGLGGVLGISVYVTRDTRVTRDT
jgi:hypothetical protein